ncbi:MAG: M3 family metallopeptidase [Bacteroidales bacterium]
MKESKLPFGVPDFTQIEDADFEPAMIEGIKEQLKEIDQIANNSEEPTFENTLVALEKSGSLLHRVNNVFGLLTGANTNDTLQAIEERMAPKLSALNDAIYLNDKLFKRVKFIFDNKESLSLDAEALKLVNYYYDNFVQSGANLPADKKEALKKLNTENATLSTKFSQNLLAAFKDGALVVDDASELAGLSQDQIQAAADNAKANGKEGKYMINIFNTTQQPALQYLTNRATRKKLFEASYNRNELGDKNDNRSLVLRLAKIRAEQAKLLGFNNYAEWNLQDQMAKTPQNVEDLLSKLSGPAVEMAKKEAKDIQKMIDKTKGGFKLEAYDWNMYSSKVRKAKYDLDENEIKPYFRLFNVLENGVFYAAHELYGLNFVRRTDLPVYADGVRTYDVMNEDGSQVGLFYCDYYKRDNKSGGAWMSELVPQSKLLNHKPVIYNVCNFEKAPDGQPTLLSYDDVETMFHEFGHALHGLLSNRTYPSITSTNVPRDFVEFPSQFNEHWALYPKVLKHYAVNEAGETIPDELIAKIKKSATFNQGYMFTELLAAAQLDMQWHMLSVDDASKVNDVDVYEKEALKKSGLLIDIVPPRYRSSYFSHIFAGGYASGYYAYIWAEMLDDDAFEWFIENGGLTRENGQRYRDMILSVGNTVDLAAQYRKFTGRDPKIEPLLKSRGIEK